MSDQINEQISALLDGELPADELSLLLRQIERQPKVLQQAHILQRARLCLQGDQPIHGISESFKFTARIQNAIRDEQAFPAYTLTDTRILASQLEQDSAGQSQNQETPEANPDFRKRASLFSTADIKKSQSDTFESGNWRPLFGAGIAAAVAIVAVSAWQTQMPDQEFSGMPSTLQVTSEAGNEFTQANLLSAQAQNPATTEQTSSPAVSSYTVPEYSSLNVEQPFSQLNNLRQVNYSDYLLQNQVAPQSTSGHLSRYAQQLRSTHTQQLYFDPKTGLVVLTFKPIESQ